MTESESPYAIAHDYALMIPAPDGVDAAIAEVLGRHEAELDAVLRPFGVALVDLLQPTWMRAVRVGDVEAHRSPAQAFQEVGLELLNRPAGGCCGSGEACSSSACTGTPREVFPEPRQDAAVFGAPTVTRGGAQFGPGFDEATHDV